MRTAESSGYWASRASILALCGLKKLVRCDARRTGGWSDLIAAATLSREQPSRREMARPESLSDLSQAADFGP